MSEKRFAGPVEGLDGTALAADYEIAAAYDKLRVGKLAVYYRDGFRVKAGVGCAAGRPSSPISEWSL